MGHYLDIELLPDPEIAAHQLLAALYGKLHRALAAQGCSTIGVSFPDYAERPAQLGQRLRLFGPQSSLGQLMAQDWLGGMHDHVAISQIGAVPPHAVARPQRRVQAKSNPDRLRRRQMARHGLSATQAAEQVPDTAAERLHLPFLQLGSASTGQRFRLYLRLGPPAARAIDGRFNTYGLSTAATVPHF